MTCPETADAYERARRSLLVQALHNYRTSNNSTVNANWNEALHQLGVYAEAVRNAVRKERK